MGAGLYVDPGGITAYAESRELAEETGEDAEDVLDMFEADLRGALTNAWSSVEGRWRRRARILAASRLHELTLHEDGYGRHHVTVALRDDLEPRLEALGQASLDVVAARVFERVHPRWPLRVRDTAWTSKPYRPTGGRRAGPGRSSPGAATIEHSP